jgi:hypothetical protein
MSRERCIYEVICAEMLTPIHHCGDTRRSEGIRYLSGVSVITAHHRRCLCNVILAHVRIEVEGSPVRCIVAYRCIKIYRRSKGVECVLRAEIYKTSQQLFHMHANGLLARNHLSSAFQVITAYEKIRGKVKQEERKSAFNSR